MTAPAPLLHETVSALADRRLTGRRWIDPAVEQRFHATMRNDFLTPRGTAYKWQEITASLDRSVVGGGVPTVVPVRYRWHRVDARTGTPAGAGKRREWTFARGQSFGSVLFHTDAEGAVPAVAEPDSAGLPPSTLDIAYPQLPKSPAVDLLLMLSWDVVTVEMMCTHLSTTPELRDVGGRAELERVSGTWAQLKFSDPGATAEFRNANATAQHLGYGRFAGRPSAVYSSRCLDCVLDVRLGPVTERGRSSYWATVQVDVETGDLLSAEMTEMIIATLTGPDGRRVPVQKRRIVRMWADTGVAEEEAEPRPADPLPRTIGEVVAADPAAPAKAIRLAGRVAEHLAWQATSLGHLPQGMSEVALMGFHSVVGADLPDTVRQVESLQAALRAVADGEPGAQEALRKALPEHRGRIEGLLAFGQLAADEATRVPSLDSHYRDESRGRLDAVGAALSELLALLGRLERPGRPVGPAPSAGIDHCATDRDPEGQP
ncbi:MAG TPA: hypothetical protein VGM10_27905 [Actinocrinis sp.]